MLGGRINMAAIQDTPPLSREVERLVTATYAPSLQDLYKLTRNVTPALINSWAVHKSCQVGALVEVLVDGLSRSRLALPLLASFASAHGFRDCLLQQHPYLLDKFLQQSTGDNESEYLSICISLLSFPLPSNIVPPASLTPFVMNIMKRIKENPSENNLRSLYLISGCLVGVVREIPQEVMFCLQAELTKTLRDLKDHMGNLLCLATFANLASSWSSMEASSWLQNIRDFFGPKRGLKTLDLVVLRVILACSSSCDNLTAEQSAESIRLAINICKGVDLAQRLCWIKGNSIKIAKLIEKASRTSIDHSVQTLGLAFLVVLIPDSTLSPDLAKLPLKWAFSKSGSSVFETLPSYTIPRLVGVNVIRSQQSALNNVLDHILSILSASGPDRNAIGDLRYSQLLLEGLRSSEILPLPSTVRVSTSEKYGNTIRDLVESFPRQTDTSDCSGAATCYHATSRLENELIFDLFTFWLEATLSEGTEPGAPQSSEIGMLQRIMTKSKRLMPHSKCAFFDMRPLDLRNSFSLPKLRNNTTITRIDWRAGMRDVMVASSHMLNDSLMQRVENICYDLEQRCGGIEAPLKQAEQERDRQSLEAERLKQQTSDLENELKAASKTISGLREEMSRLEAYANSATGRAEELSVSLAEARHALEDLQSTSDDTLNNARKEFRTKELGMIASLSAKDEHLEELQEQIQTRTQDNARLETLLATISKEKNLSLETIDMLQDGVSKLQAKLEEKNKEFAQTIAEKEFVEKQLEELQAKLYEETTESKRHDAAFRATIEKSKADLEEIRLQLEIQQSKMAEEATQQKTEIMSLQDAMHEAAANATRKLQIKEKRIEHLETKVQQLRDERAAKAREFSEAQQHISRLMGVMGFKPTSSDSRTPSKHRARRLPQSSQFGLVQAQTDTGDGISQSQSRDEEYLAASAETNTPRPEPRSPKRSRNTAFPSAQPSPPRSQGISKKSKESAFRSTSTQRRERKPFAEADVNCQPNSQLTQVTISSHHDELRNSQFSNHGDQNYLDDIDLEFSKEFVFTSTSLSELNGHAHD